MTEGSTLDELLNDPIIRLVMASDGVDPDDVRDLMEQAAMAAAVPPPHVIAHMRQAAECCA